MPDVITNNLDLWTSAILTKSTAGRGSNGKVEAYGIKKLRELILKLAVRGKLIPQDQNDETASVLLQRIAKEKTRLIKEGKSKKEKQLSEISDDERIYELPDGWEWCRLGNLFDIQDSLRVPVNSTDRAKRLGPYPYYGANGQVGFIDDFLFEGQRILIAEDGGFFDDPIRGVAYVVDGKFWVNNHAHVLECLADTNATYWVSYFNQMDWKPFVRGMTRDKLNQAAMVQIVVPVPPLAEQHRIVAKVDELMAICDQLEQQQSDNIKTHQTLVGTLLGTLTSAASPEEFAEAWTRIAANCGTLFTTEQSIDQLKHTILQLAVMGKLVPQDPNDEPASVFLKRKKRISDENMPFRIPDSWAWARVEEFAQTRLGKMLDKAKNKGNPFRYLRNINVRWFDFDLSDVKEMLFEDSELKEFTLQQGDVLICEGGYPGRAAVWDEREANIYFQKAIHRVRFRNGVNPHYFVKVLRESADSGRLNSYFTGAGIQHFTGKGLMSFLVPLPPLAEQHRIVAKVDELMALCDTLIARLADAQSTQIHLADAIVEQAVA